MLKTRPTLTHVLLWSGTGLALGLFLGGQASKHSEQGLIQFRASAAEKSPNYAAPSATATNHLHLLQSPGAVAVGRAPNDYGLGDDYYPKLLP